MDNAQLTRWKQLANDSIIATYGQDSRESRLAEALEQAVDALDDSSNKCEQCSICPDHGNNDDEGLDVDVDEILRIHGELKKQVRAFKDLHGKFDDCDEVTDVPDLVNELALQIEELEDDVDELQAEVLP